MIETSTGHGLNLDTVLNGFACKVDDYSTASIIYVGDAITGSAATSSVWRIQKIDLTTGVDVTWAGGVAEFIHRWDQRLSLVYS